MEAMDCSYSKATPKGPLATEDASERPRIDYRHLGKGKPTPENPTMASFYTASTLADISVTDEPPSIKRHIDKRCFGLVSRRYELDRCKQARFAR